MRPQPDMMSLAHRPHMRDHCKAPIRVSRADIVVRRKPVEERAGERGVVAHRDGGVVPGRCWYVDRQLTEADLRRRTLDEGDQAVAQLLRRHLPAVQLTVVSPA